VLLWAQFINRIQNEWQAKYNSYGAAMDRMEFPTKFAQAVYADMVSYFANQKINVKVVNYLTLHSYFQQRGFSAKLKMGTLDVFSMYLGYEDFSDFIKKNKKEDLHTEAALPQKEYEISEKVKKSFLRWLFKALLTPLLALKTLFFAALSKKRATEEGQLVHLIHKASALEFSLYSAIPYSKDTVKLSEYFTLDGTALQLIKGYMDGGLRNGRKLRIPGSFFEIVEVKIIRIAKDEALVKTEEKWRLLWYEMKTDKNDIVYDVLNTQMYYLKKVGGKWKIDRNEYSGKAESIVD
jgi:hypothetical protein